MKGCDRMTDLTYWISFFYELEIDSLDTTPITQVNKTNRLIGNYPKSLKFLADTASTHRSVISLKSCAHLQLWRIDNGNQLYS